MVPAIASKFLVIGSRGSPLALWQANYVASRLEALQVSSEIKIIKTTGDHLQTASLVQAGGKGLFTKEIEEALLRSEIDLAVHSLKDLPTENPPGLTIAAIPERQDPRDALLGLPLMKLPAGALVGTSSNRRVAQLRLLRPDLQFSPVRGNIDTRINKLRDGQYQALVLAAAGLIRLERQNEIVQWLTADECCPAPGQGALAIQVRTGDKAEQLCARLNHEPSQQAVLCERTLLRELGGGCQLPIGGFAAIESDGQLHALAGVFAPDGSQVLRVRGTGSTGDAARLGKQLAQELGKQGAFSILREAVV